MDLDSGVRSGMALASPAAKGRGDKEYWGGNECIELYTDWAKTPKIHLRTVWFGGGLPHEKDEEVKLREKDGNATDG